MALYLDDSLLRPGRRSAATGRSRHVFTAGHDRAAEGGRRCPVRALAAFASRLAAARSRDRPGDLHWDTADPGWATGLYSALLGPLATGRRGLLTRGAIAPVPAWRLLDRYRVTHLHAGPAYFRAMAAAGPPPPGLALRLRVVDRRAAAAGPRHLGRGGARPPLHDRYGQAELGTVHRRRRRLRARDDRAARLPGWSVAVLADDHDEPAAARRRRQARRRPGRQPADVVLRLRRRSRAHRRRRSPRRPVVPDRRHRRASTPRGATASPPAPAT